MDEILQALWDILRPCLLFTFSFYPPFGPPPRHSFRTHSPLLTVSLLCLSPRGLPPGFGQVWGRRKSLSVVWCSQRMSTGAGQPAADSFLDTIARCFAGSLAASQPGACREQWVESSEIVRTATACVSLWTPWPFSTD